MAKHLIASAKTHMPDVPVFHLTDGKCPAVGEVIRIDGEMPMGVRRLSHYARLSGEWLVVDTDVVFREDVSQIFEKPFDVALCSRKGTYMDGTRYATRMPYSFGV